jgi:hypothetical protein
MTLPASSLRLLTVGALPYRAPDSRDDTGIESDSSRLKLANKAAICALSSSATGP